MEGSLPTSPPPHCRVAGCLDSSLLISLPHCRAAGCLDSSLLISLPHCRAAACLHPSLPIFPPSLQGDACLDSSLLILPSLTQGSAGLWGTWTCNIPPWTVQRFLVFLSELQPDILVYSGQYLTRVRQRITYAQLL